eukprot:2918620-Pyramimonas_sp.AAC.1
MTDESALSSRELGERKHSTADLHCLQGFQGLQAPASAAVSCRSATPDLPASAESMENSPKGTPATVLVDGDAEDGGHSDIEEEEKMLEEKQRQEQADLHRRHLEEKERIKKKKSMKEMNLVRVLSRNSSGVSIDTEPSSMGSNPEGSEHHAAYLREHRESSGSYLHAVLSPVHAALSPFGQGNAMGLREPLAGGAEPTPQQQNLGAAGGQSLQTDPGSVAAVESPKEEHAPGTTEDRASTSGSGHEPPSAAIAVPVGAKKKRSSFHKPPLSPVDDVLEQVVNGATEDKGNLLK